MTVAEAIKTARSRRAQIAVTEGNARGATLPKRFSYRWNKLLHVYDITFETDDGQETIFAIGLVGERDAKKTCELLNHCGYIPEALQKPVTGYDPRD